MHGTPDSTTTTSGATKELRERGLNVKTPSQGLAMPSVRAGHYIDGAKSADSANRDRFLTLTEMCCSRNQALQEEFMNPVFETSDQHHPAVPAQAG
jgi:hypothetical protein